MGCKDSPHLLAHPIHCLYLKLIRVKDTEDELDLVGEQLLLFPRHLFLVMVVGALLVVKHFVRYLQKLSLNHRLLYHLKLDAGFGSIKNLHFVDQIMDLQQLKVQRVKEADIVRRKLLLQLFYRIEQNGMHLRSPEELLQRSLLSLLLLVLPRELVVEHRF